MPAAASTTEGATPRCFSGVEYYNCRAGICYRAALQGSDLVYVSTQP